MSLLYGCSLLIPLAGHEAFSAYAILAKPFHNVAGLLVMTGLWVRDNLPNRLDVDKSWAIQHHDLWYKEVSRAGAKPSAPSEPPARDVNSIVS